MRRLQNDLTGKKFGRLYVIGVADDGQRKTSYICQCDCGNVKKVRADGLTSGRTKSCGCWKKITDSQNAKNVPAHKVYEERGFKVGGTRLYHIWQGMKGRCYNEHNPSYSRYGGRGIRVCDEWLSDYIHFHNWAMENGYQDDLTLDRIDYDGNYEPGNCRWANAKQQALNRHTNINIKIGNVTKPLGEWCEIFGLEYSTVHARLKRDEDISIDRLFNGKAR